MEICNVLISSSWGEVSFETIDKGIGGREGALLFLSREFAKEGNHIINFVNIEKSKRFHFGEGTVDLVPLNLTTAVLTNFPYDVVISWEKPSIFKNQDIQTKLKICEMQVCHLEAEEGIAASKYCDYVAALSNWHKGFLLESQVNMSEDKVVVFPNGVDISRYPKYLIEKKIEDGRLYRGYDTFNRPKFVYSSSPDRGLWQLLQSWPYIRQKFPSAELKVAYGVKNWTEKLKWSHSRQGEQALQIEELMKQDGIEDIGIVGQNHLSKLQLEADAFLYPLDAINPTESGCISAIENAAAGNPLILTDCDCLPEEFGPIGVIAELPFDPEGYADCVEYVLKKPELMKELRKDGREFAESRDWSLIAKDWLTFFEKELSE
jgi:glycosyltransferase involved in cell wall biosynthesis